MKLITGTRNDRILLGLSLLATLPALHGQDAVATNHVTGESIAPVTMQKQVIIGRADSLVGVADTATAGYVGHAELARRPLLRPGELVETVPGVIATQHAGGGKANQYFLRGFNLDHGTDFAGSLDGVPLNLGSHGHGQGYLDINYLIPEITRAVAYRKGPYAADVGDFGTAGAADFEYYDQLPTGLASFTGGTHGYYRGLVADSAKVGPGHLLYALEGFHDDGAWATPNDYLKLNGVLRYAWDRGDNHFSVSAMGYHGDWNSTDQVPLRAIETGVIGRFGTLDPSSGGETYRYSLQGNWHRHGEDSLTKAVAYSYFYGLDLWSNFTGYLDPVDGDEIEQRDRRNVSGFKLSHTLDRDWAGKAVSFTGGLDFRADNVGNGLFKTKDRARLATTREDDVFILGVSPYVENRVKWTDWFRSVVGVRGDLYHFQLDNDQPLNTGGRSDALASPKASLVFGPWADTELYLSGGYGFHSNDGRGVVSTVDPGDPTVSVRRSEPLVQQRGAEVGVRTSFVNGLQSSVSLWVLESDSETVFVGDAGTTEDSGRSGRRYGVEFANFYNITPWLALDADLSLSEARFRDQDPAGDHIPDAVEMVFAGGLSVHDLHGFFGSLRLRYFGPRDLIEDGSIRSAANGLVNLRVGYQWERWTLALEVLNLLDRRANDQEYYYPSRLLGEAPGPDDGGYLDRHIHPIEPRLFRATLSTTF